MRRPAIADPHLARVAGWCLFVAGAFVLYDAYDRRGGHAPWPLGAVLPF